MDTHHKRTGNLWTDEEEKELIKELKQGLDISIIASQHQRTTKAIDMRMEMIYKNMITQGISQEKLFNIFGNKCIEYEKKKSSYSLDSIHNDINLLQNKLDRIQHLIEKLYKRIKLKEEK